MRTLAEEWTATGATAMAAVVIAAIVLHRRPVAVALVDAPLIAAGLLAVWVGRSFEARSPLQRAWAGRTISMCIVVAAAAAFVVVAVEGRPATKAHETPYRSPRSRTRLPSERRPGRWWTAPIPTLARFLRTGGGA